MDDSNDTKFTCIANGGEVPFFDFIRLKAFAFKKQW
uniref:Uncharacterized protein n=1 Tax=viral metagenome TaxID=1070528 RepID=A0A6C0IXN8_9ZZZZ